MKKKLLAVLLATTMVASLVACGSGSGSGSSSSDSSSSGSGSTSSSDSSSSGGSSSDSSAGIDTSEHVVITYMTTGDAPTQTKDR